LKGNYLEIIRKKRKIGLVNEAISYCQKALQKNFIDKAIVWYELGCIYFKIKDYHKAMYAFQKSLEINDKDYISWYALGITYKKLKLWDEAIKCFNKAIELNPKYWQAHASLLKTYLRLFKLKDAWYCFKRTIKELKET